MNRQAWRRKYPCFVVAPQNTFAWVRPATVKAAVAKAGREAFPAKVDKRRRPFVMTQLSKPDDSSLQIVFGLIEKMRKDFRIDEARIYVLGGSMGGYGAWAAMQEGPELFAAGIAVCGGPYVYLDLARIRNVPVWAFHGTADGTVPYQKARGAFETLKAIGGNCKLTSFKGKGHAVSGIAFRYEGDDQAKGSVTEYSGPACDRESDVWQWLFRQRRKTPPSHRTGPSPRSQPPDEDYAEKQKTRDAP